jgi:hypothetical protein
MKINKKNYTYIKETYFSVYKKLHKRFNKTMFDNVIKLKIDNKKARKNCEL